jgi:leucyl aminopeptidase (aminopeptidase T)
MNTIFSPELNKGALTVARDVCKIQKGEKVLIISNPEENTAPVSHALFAACTELGAEPVLVFQKPKTLLDYADKIVIEAMKTEPDVIWSISANKLGKDEQAMKNPYKTEDGREFKSIFDYLLDGKKTARAVWTPGITLDMFMRTVCIDYKQLSERCKRLQEILTNAEYVHVTAPGGTDIKIPVKGRKPFADDGDFSKPGAGGNIPAGEVYISPVVGGSEGIIVYDGSMSVKSGDIVIKDPIICKVEKGFVTDIKAKSGKPLSFESVEAGILFNTIDEAEKQALQMEKDGKLPEGTGEVYKKNARNIGELGIGLNPAAKITGNMLEDEKAFRTCHFAIGMNYDGDADSLIHLDGVVTNPTIEVFYADKNSVIIEKNGILQE